MTTFEKYSSSLSVQYGPPGVPLLAELAATDAGTRVPRGALSALISFGSVGPTSHALPVLAHSMHVSDPVAETHACLRLQHALQCKEHL